MVNQQMNHVTKDIANALNEMVRDDLNSFQIATSGIINAVLQTMTKLETHTRWSAQTVHQAHHQDQAGYWFECPKNTCDSAQQALGIVRE